MDKYIEREIAINRIRKVANMIGFENPAVAIDCTISVLENTPAADVAPVRHGRWIERKSFHAEGGISATCSACQIDVQYLGNPLKYCPHCGAKMDLED